MIAESKFKAGQELYHEGCRCIVNDIYESPASGEIILELRQHQASGVVQYILVREDDIATLEGGY